MMRQLTSSDEKQAALKYLQDRLEGSILFDLLDLTDFSQRDAVITLVSSPSLPSGHDYREGWIDKDFSAFQWLVEYLFDYLTRDESNLAVIEDPSGKPTHSKLLQGAPAPAWFFDDRVLWPVRPPCTKETVQASLRWGLVGWLELIVLSRDPTCSYPKSQTSWVSKQGLTDIAGMVTAFVTDVFDGDGYILWQTGPASEK
jgi:hypothetical protein